MQPRFPFTTPERMRMLDFIKEYAFTTERGDLLRSRSQIILIIAGHCKTAVPRQRNGHVDLGYGVLINYCIRHVRILFIAYHHSEFVKALGGQKYDMFLAMSADRYFF